MCSGKQFHIALFKLLNVLVLLVLNKVFAEYAKSSKKLKILNGLINEAHSEFLGILSETQKLKDILNKCGKQPFLLREYALLEEDLRIYHAAKKEPEREKCSYGTPKTDISFKPG